VIQFSECILAFEKIVGKIDYAVAHSMGGAAIIYATKLGFSAKRCCILSTPTVADDIIEVFRDRMNASAKTKKKLRQEIFDRYKIDFEHFTAAYLARETKLPPTLLIYDQNDDDVPTYHAKVLQEAIPGSELIYTSNLGHTRILKDVTVAQYILHFIEEDSKENNVH